MTDRVGRHAAARDLAETLIIPAQQAWAGDEPTAGPDAVSQSSAQQQTSVPRAAGRHASGRTADLARPAGAGEALGADPGRTADLAGTYRAGGGGGTGPGRTAPADRAARVAGEQTGPAMTPAGGAKAMNGYGSPLNGQQSLPNGHQGPANGHQSLPNGHQGAAARAQQQRPLGGDRRLRVVWVYPDLLSTYGDRGNLLVLSRRAALRGIEVEAIEVNADEPVPSQGDIYLLGGGEDLPQILAANRLRQDGGLVRAADRGAVVFAVCAGYQVIGDSFGGVEGEPVAGLGILDISSGRGDRRGVGELVADVDPTLGVPRLTGFENHQGMTRIGSGARPLAKVSLGVGNGDGTEGAYAGKVLGTYMHGPALARNPGLADLLLSWAVGQLPQLDPDAEEWASRLRSERLAAVER
jgi:lipid II isoglutaminyl synthase (glutamine-hydrolysing)